jgi:hypothetical protein
MELVMMITFLSKMSRNLISTSLNAKCFARGYGKTALTRLVFATSKCRSMQSNITLILSIGYERIPNMPDVNTL